MIQKQLLKLWVVFVFIGVISINAKAQEYFPKNDGVKATNTNYVAFTNAKIYVSPDQVLSKGTLLIKDGKVAEVGSSVSIPVNAIKIDLSGKSIYPSFIDAYSSFGMPEVKSPRRGFGTSPQYDSEREGYYWNDHIRAETKAIESFSYNSKAAEELLKEGFGVVNTHVQDGIVRGTGVLVALNNFENNSKRILDDQSAQYFSFSKSSASNQVYPTSLMGAIALLKQLYLDADWYTKGNVTTKDLTLEAFNHNRNQPQIFFTNDKHNALRADKIGDANGVQYIMVAKGNEYQLIDEIKKTNASFIVPLNFPKAYDMTNPFQADYVSLEDMRFWNQAPGNPAAMADQNIAFSLTTHQLKSPSEFKKNLSKAITYGLDKTKALEALTTVPAQILNKSDQLGSLKKGMIANFLITSGDIFDDKTKLYENWVQGSKFVISDMNIRDLSGMYDLAYGDQKLTMTITGEPAKPTITVKRDSVKIDAKINYKDDWLSIILEDGAEITRLKTSINEQTNDLVGTATISNGNTVDFTAKKSGSSTTEEKKESSENKAPEIMPVSFPNSGLGFKEKPIQETILFKNATVWTNEVDGILMNTDVLVKDGIIAKIGTDLKAGRAKVIDATGKHLTPGIIDEHTHIATMSVNEAGHNSTAEVTNEDDIDSEDLGIYRNLAGGVTTVQVLHGSANPIGGRSAILKLKWGETGDQMLFPNSPQFIKFALGENVKQSRLSNGSSRFPQSRMGVEQVYMDYFQRAKEYDALKKSGKPYRKDLEMETLAEILNEERFITCHSYVQSEINMLMKVAEKFDFRVNTFTHILEGYKVADKMKEHGVGGSTFSDWWAYKYEVNDAIPYNAAIMHNVGVLVAINSDDAEMSRRLNQEAAKTIKYGGVSEEDALKFVTLNPAKLLHIDHKVGSLKVGKDADLVLWNDHPLSVYAKAEKTMIDGIVYFDIERDQQMRADITKERNQLINMMLNEKGNGATMQKPRKKDKIQFHCDTVEQIQQ